MRAPGKWAILFDLDGTLVDSRPGIIRCMSSVLKERGITPPRNLLESLIGNPLHDTFSKLFHEWPRDRASALSAYRSLYAREGLYECSVCPGIPGLLSSIAKRGWWAYVVTGKPRCHARRLIRYLRLAPYFVGIYGSYLDGRFERKAELLEHVMRVRRLRPHRTIMIGDRASDIAAAREVGIGAVGVAYGYGSVAELQRAGAACVCSRPSSLLDALKDGAGVPGANGQRSQRWLRNRERT
jgi:phosphoglycolate phosphatase